MGPAMQPERSWRFAALSALGLVVALACDGERTAAPASSGRARATAPAPERAAVRPSAGEDDQHAARRRAMVDEQLAANGIRDPRVLAAMHEVPRHAFV